MSDWTWEYVPDAANVVGGLTQAQIEQVEILAPRVADGELAGISGGVLRRCVTRQAPDP